MSEDREWEVVREWSCGKCGAPDMEIWRDPAKTSDADWKGLDAKCRVCAAEFTLPWARILGPPTPAERAENGGGVQRPRRKLYAASAEGLKAFQADMAQITGDIGIDTLGRDDTTPRQL